MQDHKDIGRLGWAYCLNRRRASGFYVARPPFAPRLVERGVGTKVGSSVIEFEIRPIDIATLVFTGSAKLRAPGAPLPAWRGDVSDGGFLLA
jgi:hypothetical protein